MANWQRTLDLVDLYQKWKAEEITIQQLAKSVAERLTAIKNFDIEYIDNDKETIAEEFEGIAEDETADADDFDFVLDHLYYWADRELDTHWNGKKVCWVKTF